MTSCPTNGDRIMTIDYCDITSTYLYSLTSYYECPRFLYRFL